MKIFSVVGYSNSGKTTFVKKISDFLDGRVGVVKNLHRFEKKGKNTGKLIESADRVVAAAEERTYNIKTSKNPLEDSLNELLGEVDYAILEGGKDSDFPKIALGEEVVGDCNGERFLVLEEKPDFEEEKGAIVNFIKNESLERVNYREIVRKMKKGPKLDKAGAIGGFTGIVRGFRDGEKVKKLVFEKFEEKSELEIEKIEEELRSKEGIIDVKIYHREGELDVGEDIVYVVVAAEHREELFEAVEKGINLVKERAPIWKKEILVDGESWVHDL
ncbi:molybdopterin synthase [archaeon SCG-AAA382B04]|nr:molybdopterin synthase [archaeon SCG-AAA382B04]